MRKIYISADVEGLNGITSFRQVFPEFVSDYAQMQPQLHLELNSLINGLKKAGIEEIVVNDAHNTMTNICLSLLPSDVKLISGKPKKVSMMYGLDETFDGVIFFAYHSKAGSKGVLAHTFNMYFKNVYLNGEKFSEAQLNAIYARKFNLPILLASGDDIFAKEIQKDLGNIYVVKTKSAISNSAAICEKNTDLLDNYEYAGQNINNFEKILYKEYKNYELLIEFEDEIFAQNIAQKTKLRNTSNTISFTSKDYEEIYTTLQKLSSMTTLQKNQTLQV